MLPKKLEGETSNFGGIKVQLLQVFEWEDKNRTLGFLGGLHRYFWFKYFYSFKIKRFI